MSGISDSQIFNYEMGLIGKKLEDDPLNNTEYELVKRDAEYLSESFDNLEGEDWLRIKDVYLRTGLTSIVIELKSQIK